MASNRPAFCTAARRLWRVAVVIAPPGLTPAGEPDRAPHQRRSNATPHHPNCRPIPISNNGLELFIPRACCLCVEDIAQAHRTESTCTIEIWSPLFLVATGPGGAMSISPQLGGGHRVEIPAGVDTRRDARSRRSELPRR